MKLFSKKSLMFLLKASISFVVLYIIISNIDWEKVGANLKGADFLLLTFALFFNIVERGELTLKWNILIWVRNIKISFSRLFLINIIGSFWGMFLPSSLGTDLVRGYYLTKNNSEKSVSISSVFIDRILGVFSLLILGTITLFFADDLINNAFVKFYLIGLICLICIFIYYFQKESTFSVIKRIILKIKWNKISNAIISLNKSIIEYKKFPKSLFYSFLISLLVQITRVLTYYFIAIAFNIHVPFFYFLLFIPIIMLVIMLPISIGGLGVKEGTFIAFFSFAGMSVENAVIISFTNTIVNTLVSLLGGVVYLFYDPSPQKQNISAIKN